MRVLLLTLLGLASAFGFAPGAMPMQLQRSQASVVLSPQMKALNKPARLSEVRRKYNKHHKSEMRTYIKKARRAPLQLPSPRSAASSRSSRSPALEQRLAPRSVSSALPLCTSHLTHALCSSVVGGLRGGRVCHGLSSAEQGPVLHRQERQAGADPQEHCGAQEVAADLQGQGAGARRRPGAGGGVGCWLSRVPRTSRIVLSYRVTVLYAVCRAGYTIDVCVCVCSTARAASPLVLPWSGVGPPLSFYLLTR